jgi:sialate O-acetylesterase
MYLADVSVHGNGGIYRDPLVTAFFDRDSGWIASDGCISIPLSDGRVLWTMGDSYIGQLDPLTGTTGCLFQVRNSALLQPMNNWAPAATTTLIGHSRGIPSLFKNDPNDHQLLWPTGGYQYKDTVYVYNSSQKDTIGGLGFTHGGKDFLAKLLMPGLQIAGYDPLPDFGGVEFGLGFDADEPGDYVYTWGIQPDYITCRIVAARFPRNNPRAPWAFWNGKAWDTVFAHIAPIAVGASNGSYVAKVKNKYVLVSTEFSVSCDAGTHIYVATSDSLTGPFSANKVLYTIPDKDLGHTPFFYGPVIHPEYINSKNELLITYDINGYSDCEPNCINNGFNPDYYRPRGLRVPLSLIDPKFSSQLVLPACFTDNMVLQQRSKVNFWGNETPGKRFTLLASWNNKTYPITADAEGHWQTKVTTPVYGGPYTITFDDGHLTTLKNVLIGEVWVCSGQSNMEMPLTGYYGDVLNLADELADAANYPQIRMLTIDHQTSFTPRSTVNAKGGWAVCNPQTVRDFSAVAYFFAKNLFPGKRIPIGIINSSWGGTVAEAWTSGAALKTMPGFAPFVSAVENGLTQKKLDTAYQINVREWIDSINAKDPGFQQGQPRWTDRAFDDAGWQTMNLPGYWERAGVPDYDGTMWFRKKVVLPAAWAGRDLKLYMDGIDDFDVSFFNGTEIGHMESFFYKRSYIIPGGLVKSGENSVAVRVFDNGGLGGINNGPLRLSLAADTSGQIDLAGPWAFRKATVLTQLPLPPLMANSINRPTLIYNAMINPILRYTIKGVLWYQGESNADRAAQYRRLLPTLIHDWRQHWGEGNFPFYFTQLANYTAGDQGPAANWPALREAQLGTLGLANTGMAVTIDIGEADRIHPRNKQEVGRRLALIARARTYGERLSYSGPIYSSQIIKGDTIELSFTHIDRGLVAKVDGSRADTLKGFTIAGADKKFYPARAFISGKTVRVSSSDVPRPVAVRYAWANNPVCNLYNGAGLPASPFRTDNW